MINSTQYKKHAIKSHYPYMLVLRRYWKPMLGTCMFDLIAPEDLLRD